MQVTSAVSSFKEEKARADDREALLHEMLLTERDKEDRYTSPNDTSHRRKIRRNASFEFHSWLTSAQGPVQVCGFPARIYRRGRSSGVGKEEEG